jgi:hypothetical protein
MRAWGGGRREASGHTRLIHANGLRQKISLPIHNARHGLDLGTETIVKRGHGSDRAGGSDNVDPFGMDAIEDGPVVDIGDVNADLSEFVDPSRRRCQCGRDIGQRLKARFQPKTPWRIS